MPSREGHTPLGGMVSDAAHDAWSAWCDERGLDVTAVLEALGQRIADGQVVFVDEADLVQRARHVMSARKTRRRRS